jgi:N-acetylglucosaminyldiphosphoundecaprenol N-acetyl-beta-D-mannosaminyltransferase
MEQETSSFACCGVRIDPMRMEQAIHAVLNPTDAKVGRAVHLCNAYTLSLAGGDPSYLEMLNQGDYNLPDGMPLIWIAERLGIAGLQGRVYGPDLTLGVFDVGRAQGARHYLYGAAPETVAKMAVELERRYPGVNIVGIESPPFRPLSQKEEGEVARRIAESAADIVWVGIGTPRQDWFCHDFAQRVPATFVAVGAAFDFIAGEKRQAPSWMQEHGLEWAYRLITEPRRLASRYLIHNARFVRGVIRSRPFIVER